MKKIFKKIGQILLCFLPFIVTMGIQIIISFPVTFYYMWFVAATKQLPNNTDELVNWILTDMLTGDYAVIATACWGIASLITFFFWYHKQQGKKESIPLKQSVNLYSIGGLVLMVCGLQLAIQYLYSFIEFLKPEWFYAYNQLMSMENYSSVGMVIMVLYGVIVAPIHEEYLVRGVTMNYAKKAMPFWIANLLQAFIFGFLHMNLIQGSYAFIIGLLLGYVMHRAKNIWIPIIFHFFFNAFGSFIPLSLLNTESASAYLLVTIIGVCIMSAGIILFELTIKNRNIALGVKE